jgi:SynChlorMet cassette protein ScmC
MQNKSGYRLQLANDQCWHITGLEGASPWLDKFARMMELVSSSPNGQRRLIFQPRDLNNVHSERAGWKTHDLKYLKIWSQNHSPETVCELGDQNEPDAEIVKMWFALQPIYKQAVDSGGLPFHAGLVAKDQKGILLAAPGGTGKSTCCRRIPPPWKAWSDDEALIVLDKNNNYVVHPMPTWSDYLYKRAENTWRVEEHIPLSAVFFIAQAETDKVTPLGTGQATVLIYEAATQVYRRYLRNLEKNEERSLKLKLFENATDLAKAIPAFVLEVSLTGQFWKEIEKVMPSAKGGN